MNRFQFVADHQRRYGVKRLCTILGIARSSFYYWRRTAADRAARQAADARLAARIQAVHRESDGTYGVPRSTAELRDDGERINHKRIARVMRSIGLAGVRLRRRHRTTIPDPAAVKAPDLIGRDFTAREPNTKYVGDITYLPLEGGKFLYFATVIDLASRRLAGWAIADHMRTGLVTDALAAAERTCGSLAGAVLHTDHGAQYTSRAFATAGHLAAYAGLAPVTRASGSSIRGEHPARRGNKQLKRAFCLAAFASLSQPESRAYYEETPRGETPRRSPDHPRPPTHRRALRHAPRRHLLRAPDPRHCLTKTIGALFRVDVAAVDHRPGPVDLVCRVQLGKQDPMQIVEHPGVDPPLDPPPARHA